VATVLMIFPNTVNWWRNVITRWWNDNFRWWNGNFRWQIAVPAHSGWI